jgi:ribosome-binding protein aMBF1 (putative translation factor)
MMETNRIRYFRQKAGLSRTKLADKLGLAASTLTVIELGKLESHPRIRKELSDILGIEEMELFPQQKLDLSLS